MKPKLFFVISTTSGNRFQDQYWMESAHQFMDEYDVRIIQHGQPKDDYQLVDDIAVKTAQFTEVFELFSSGQITDDDIFFFTDAWNFGVIPLSYLRKSLDLKTKFIGYWGQSFFDGDTFNVKKFYQTKTKTGFAKNFEKGLIQSYTYNLFPNTGKAIAFRIRYFPLIAWNPVYVCPFPFDYIRQAKQIQWEKENSIIVPYEPTREIEYDMIEDLKVNNPNLKIVYASKLRMTRDTYLQELSKAKIMLITPKIARLDPVLIWEAMQYGVVPLISSDVKLQQLDDTYKYPSEIFTKSKTVLHFFRKKERLEMIINDMTENRDEYLAKIDEDLPKFTQFSNEHFCELLSGDVTNLEKIKSETAWIKNGHL